VNGWLVFQTTILNSHFFAIISLTFDSFQARQGVLIVDSDNTRLGSLNQYLTPKTKLQWYTITENRKMLRK
jgi:hypothetical protein